MKRFFLAIGFLSIFFSSSNIALAADNCSWTKADSSFNNGLTTLSCPATKPRESTNGSSCSGSKPLFYLCCCDAASANVAAIKETKALFTIPDFQVKIPGLDKLATVTCVIGQECNIPWIGQYIAGIYNYALAIVGILAAIVLMAGGLMWLISAGDASKITQAKELVIGSISGLIILIASYALLITINPDLVNLKGVNITSIKRVDVEPIANGSDSSGNTSGICPNDSYLLDIKGLVSTNASTPMLSAGGVAGLEKAIAKAKELGVSLYVTSAFRSESNQQTLWEDAIVKYGDMASKYVARPGSCGGHRNGATIDVCIKGTKSCGHIGGATNAKYTDADVDKIKQIMMQAGWVRYCAEWWHYQYNNSPSSPCSP